MLSIILRNYFKNSQAGRAAKCVKYAVRQSSYRTQSVCSWYGNFFHILGRLAAATRTSRLSHLFTVFSGYAFEQNSHFLSQSPQRTPHHCVLECLKNTQCLSFIWEEPSSYESSSSTNTSHNPAAGSTTPRSHNNPAEGMCTTSKSYITNAMLYATHAEAMRIIHRNNSAVGVAGVIRSSLMDHFV